MGIRTIKLPYKSNNSQEQELINLFIMNYNNVLKFTYNRIYDSQKCQSTAELTRLQKSMKNIFIDSHFLNSAQFDAKAIFSANKGQKVIFGGKKSFLQRNKGKISREEWKLLKYRPMTSIGEANQKGNRKFKLLSDNQVLFKPNKDSHFVLALPKLRKNLKRDINKLIELQNSKSLAITYGLDFNNVYISFENNALNEIDLKRKVRDRVMSIDMNPNYIGWSVIDWKSSKGFDIINSGAISIKSLNDKEAELHVNSSDSKKKYFTDKRQFEIVQIAEALKQITLHYKCELFAIEDLSMQSNDKSKGKRYNRLCNNQWCRNLLEKQLEKRLQLINCKLIRVLANYSSFEGNLVYRSTGLPDMCLASIEIGRRGFEFYHQYMLKDKPIQKNIVFNGLDSELKSAVLQSLEELKFSIEDFISWKDLYKKIRKMKYRIPFQECTPWKVFSKKHIKSMVKHYVLI